MGRPRKEPVSGRDVYVANESFSANIDGIPMSFNRDTTRVSRAWLDTHPEIRHLFERITVHYDVESATAAPGETREAAVE
jgi:hypothetical protein